MRIATRAVTVCAALLCVNAVLADEPVFMRYTDLKAEASLGEFQPVPRDQSDSLFGTVINANAGSGIAGNSAALAAFGRAVQNWQNVLGDAVTLNINIDMAALEPNTLGSTSTPKYTNTYTTIRNLVAGGGDTGSAAEAATLSYLPTISQFGADRPPGFTLSTTMWATRANLLALGVPQSSLGGYGTSDGSITFGTGIPWDYDSSNGITPGTFAFESTAMHEIGHVLGFTSEVDYVDWCLKEGLTDTLWPRPLDLFRFAAGNVPATSSAFTTNARDLAPGGTDYLCYVLGTIQMATGSFAGDGNQASHWKDFLGLGLMDPTSDPGGMKLIGGNDLLAMDLIGWQIVPEPTTLALLVVGLSAMAIRRRK